MKKVIIIALGIIFLAAAGAGIVWFLSSRPMAKIATIQTNIPPFLFLRDGKIEKYDNGVISDTIPVASVNAFVYDKNSKTIYYLQWGEIFTQKISSASAITVTNTNHKIIDFSLAPHENSLAFITADFTAPPIATTSQFIRKIYLLNPLKNTSILLKQLTSQQVANFVSWTTNNQITIKESTLSALLRPEFWQISPGRQDKLMNIDPNITEISFSPDQKYQAKLRVIGQSFQLDLNGQNRNVPSGPVVMAWSPDSNLFAISSGRKLAWTVPTKIFWKETQIDHPITEVKISPGGQGILLDAGGIYFININTGLNQEVVNSGSNIQFY